MARCLGPNPPYGCGHFKEHQTAARKGWITRRQNAQFLSEEEHAAISAIYGHNVVHAHLHASHKGMVRYKWGNNIWYEVEKETFDELVADGRKLLKEEEKARAKAAKDDERRARQHERDLARAKTIEEREAKKAEIKAEKQRAGLERYYAREERRAKVSGQAQYKNVVKRLRQMGGIKPNRELSNGKIPELEEWKDLPHAVKTRKRGGVALDDAAATIREEFPELLVERGGRFHPIETSDDLAQFLKRKGNIARVA